MPLASQSPSPSHSATSSIRKRKLLPDDHAPPIPSSLSDALTSNDDLDSVSAAAADSESLRVDGSSMRTFTASRLGNTKVKTVNSIKVEPTVVGKDGDPAPATGNSGLGVVVVKEDTVKNIFTENIQTSGAYSAREENLKREEEAGRLKFACVSNDGIDEHMVWLIGLKIIFGRQLPNMPKEYIVRLLMDSQKFGEIAFCAISGDEQVKGYGTRLMNHLKQHARDVDGLTHFLTYADNNAVGYFVKQGFTKEIHLEKERWQGRFPAKLSYIKDYDGGILMECKIDLKLPYTDLSTMIHRQRQAIDEKIRELSNCHIVYTGIDFQKKEAGIPKKIINVEDLPGLNLAFYCHLQSLFKQAMNDHPDAWPFKEPVDARDVPDYYDIIKDPMVFLPLWYEIVILPESCRFENNVKRVESEQYYVTFEMFVADARRMFANARTYNSPETIYYKCASRHGWKPISRAKFNRVSNRVSRPSIDILLHLEL
ncbi:hypothetical protein C3L33_07447, partial [Rhododendron williamsianum]